MSTAARPVPPPPTCPGEYVGRCAKCQAPCHRYGPGGNPLCVVCLDEVRAARGGRF